MVPWRGNVYSQINESMRLQCHSKKQLSFIPSQEGGLLLHSISNHCSRYSSCRTDSGLWLYQCISLPWLFIPWPAFEYLLSGFCTAFDAFDIFGTQGGVDLAKSLLNRSYSISNFKLLKLQDYSYNLFKLQNYYYNFFNLQNYSYNLFKQKKYYYNFFKLQNYSYNLFKLINREVLNATNWTEGF